MQRSARETTSRHIGYGHAYEVISAHGESGVTARLEPVTIDGLVYCSSIVVLYAARHQLRVPALAPVPSDWASWQPSPRTWPTAGPTARSAPPSPPSPPPAW
jgi:hypothetical protein